MQSEELLSFLPPVVRQHMVPIFLGLLGLILIVVGLVPALFKQSSTPEVVFESSSAEETQASAAEAKTEAVYYFVDVAGAVVRPGVYRVESDARVQEAVSAAGGFTDTAYHEWIAKNLNLASKLHDEEKLYIPFQGEEAPSSQSVSSKEGVSGGLINLNSATQAQLESLPGIGPVTATKIMSGRPYSAINDLQTKKIVGASVFGKIKEQIAVN